MWLHFTLEDNTPIWINMDAIVHMRAVSKDGDDNMSELLTNTGYTVVVKEACEDMMDILVRAGR